MLSNAQLRRMRGMVERYAEAVRPQAVGSWDDNAGGWSDIDEAHRSLVEAAVYLDCWLLYRERHGRDPVTGGS